MDIDDTYGAAVRVGTINPQRMREEYWNYLSIPTLYSCYITR